MSANNLARSFHFSRERGAACVARQLLCRLHSDDNAEAWHALGVALLQLGERAAATVAFKNALRVDQGSMRSQLALGNLLFDAGQCERALSCFGMGAGAMTHTVP